MAADQASAEAIGAEERRTGAAISGVLHGALIAVVAVGLDWSAPGPATPLSVTEVTLIDASAFEAQLSAAPAPPADAPDALAEPGPGAATTEDESPQAAPEIEPEPGDTPEAPLEAAVPEPEPAPEAAPVLSTPPPPTPVPSEAARPSIAEVPSPEVLPRDAAEPESPLATEPVQPLASAEAPAPDGAPARPPDPEPEPEPEPAELAEPEPEPKREEETEEVAEATQPDAPAGPDPVAARLPVAKPSDLAAAARASRQTRQAQAQPEPEPEREREPETEEPPQQAAAEPEPEPAPQPATTRGSASRFAAQMTRGEKDALSIGIRRYFVYNGTRADPRLAVKIGIRLDRSGRIVQGPELLTAQGADRAAQNALFQAGRRALLRAQNAGEFARLPAAKFEAWTLIHVTFTPEDIGFQS